LGLHDCGENTILFYIKGDLGLCFSVYRHTGSDRN